MNEAMYLFIWSKRAVDLRACYCKLEQVKVNDHRTNLHPIGFQPISDPHRVFALRPEQVFSSIVSHKSWV